MLITVHHDFKQDLPDIQELIAEVNAEKYSLQAAAILGESISWADIFWLISGVFTILADMFCVSDTDEPAEVPAQQQVKDNTVSRQYDECFPLRHTFWRKCTSSDFPSVLYLSISHGATDR